MNRRAQDPEQHQDQDRKDQNGRKSRKSGRAIVVRVYWMFLGFIPMVASIAAITGSNGSSAADVAYWASVSSILLARLYDVSRLDGRTAEGDPATLADWGRHAVTLLVVATVLRIAIHLLQGRS